MTDNHKVAARALKILSSAGYNWVPPIDEDTIENWAMSMNGITLETAERACVELTASSDKFPSLSQFIAQTRLIRRLEKADEYVPSGQMTRAMLNRYRTGESMRAAIRARKGGLHRNHAPWDASGCPTCVQASHEREHPEDCVACQELGNHGFRVEHHRGL